VEWSGELFEEETGGTLKVSFRPNVGARWKTGRLVRTSGDT